MRNHILIARVFTNDWASLEDGKLFVTGNVHTEVEWLPAKKTVGEYLYFGQKAELNDLKWSFQI